MKRITVAHSLRRAWPLLLLAALLALPGAAPAANSGHTYLLPFVTTPPRTFLAGNETELADAIHGGNGDNLLPRIELQNDITLTEPLPALDNPKAGTAIIDGNGYRLDGQWNGPILTINAGTAVLLEDLTLERGWGICGGAIHNEGVLTIRNSLLTHNRAANGGGICVVTPSEPGITDDAILTLESTTLSDNEATQFGGAIYAVAASVGQNESGGDVKVTVSQSRLVRNAAGDDGGGIFAHGGANNLTSLHVFETTLDGNEAINGRGGAISTTTSSGFVYLKLNRSTVSANTAATGAGLYNQGATGFTWYSGGRADAEINNSTFSGNVATDSGGAIANVDIPEGGLSLRTPQDPPPIGGAYVFLAYSTLAFNRAGNGGGIMDHGATFLMAAIVADNEGGDCDALVGSAGYNLDGDESCGLDSASDVPGGLAGLRPLALNAPGLTMTHALGPASAARDRIPAGEVTGCAMGLPNPDQRGVARPQPAGGRCDIGAFEARPGD